MRFQFTVNMMQTIACKCWFQDAAFFLTRRRPRSKMLQVPSKNKFSSKMLQIACECEILAPKWSKLHILVPQEQITRKSAPNWKTKQKIIIAPKNKCLALVFWDTLSRILVLQPFSTSYSLHCVIQGVVTLGKHKKHNKTNYGFILSACYFLFISFQLSH